MEEVSSCSCLVHPELTNYNIDCSVIGNISWTGPLCFGMPETLYDQVKVSYRCPSDYCNVGQKSVSFETSNDTDGQCAFKRAGRLWRLQGQLQPGYWIFPMHLLPNNNNLALLIFFAAAGFLLVFFINVFNLIGTQGMINDSSSTPTLYGLIN